MFASLKSPMERNALLMFYALATPGNHILMFHARNGVGKNALVKQVGLSLGVLADRIGRWSVPNKSGEDLGGWPLPGEKGMRFAPPERMLLLNDGRPAILLLDELGDATRDRQAAAHELLDSRMWGDVPVSEHFKIIGALNPPEYSTDAQEMGFGFSNRSVFVPFETPSKPDFSRYRARNGRPQRFVFPELTPEKLEESRSYINGVAVAFFGSETDDGRPVLGHPHAVLEENPKDDDVAGRWPMAFATPRSWDYALNLYATALAAGDREAARILMAGAVGEPQALVFAAFERDQDLVQGLVAAKDPSLFIEDPKRPDRTFAQLMVVMTAVTDKTFKGKDAVEWWNRGFEFLAQMKLRGGAPWSAVPKEYAVVAMSHLAENQPSSGALLDKHSELIAELTPMVMASRG